MRGLNHRCRLRPGHGNNRGDNLGMIARIAQLHYWSGGPVSDAEYAHG